MSITVSYGSVWLKKMVCNQSFISSHLRSRCSPYGAMRSLTDVFVSTYFVGAHIKRGDGIYWVIRHPKSSLPLAVVDHNHMILR